MDISGLRQTRRNLDKFIRRFDGCVKTRPSRRHMRTYLRGQVSDLPRKNVEAIALEAGVVPRTLVQFLGLHRWDHEAVRLRVQDIVRRDHPDDNAIAVIDETGMPKKGDKTVGVERQYCGATGKIDNCVVTVNLGYVAGDFHALIDTDLYLPEKSWHDNRVRCRAAGIPDTVVYRPKWKIALEQLNRAMDNGVRLRFLTADEAYGGCSGFRDAVAALGMTYVVEVPRSTWGWTKKPPVIEPEASSAMGRPRTKPRLAAGSPPARRVDRLWRRGGPRWEFFHIKNTEKGPLVWEVRATRFFASQESLPGQEGWLIVARNVSDGEVKYFLANAPRDFPIQQLLHIAFSRWHIERIYEDAKGQVGLDQFQVHQYLPVMRHLILSMVSLLFLMKETTRLREKKLSVERATGPLGCRSATGPDDPSAPAPPATGEDRCQAPILSSVPTTCCPNTSKKTTPQTQSERYLRLHVA